VNIVSLAGASSIIGLAVGVLLVMILLGVLGVFVVVIVANRAEADASGRRPLVVYLFGVAFITIWTAFIGSVAVVSSVVQLIGSHPGGYGGALHPIGDATARGVVLGGLIFIVSLGTFVIHFRKGVEFADAQDQSSSPAKRCQQSYVAAVAFISVLIIVVSLVFAVYAIFQILAPGVFGGAGSIATLRYLLDAIFVALAGCAILWRHLMLAAPQLWTRRAVTIVEGPGSSPDH
jgi:hypothetical protein